MSAGEPILREKINQVTSFDEGNNLEKLKNHIQHYLVGQAELVEAMFFGTALLWACVNRGDARIS